jgi:hypothetical protein
MNISIFKTYVITVESIEICKELIEKELSIVFTAHESSYFGDYFKSFFLNAHLNLAPNYNEMEADWTVPAFKRFNTILKISISSGKKKDRLDTAYVLDTQLTRLNFQLVQSDEIVVLN